MSKPEWGVKRTCTSCSAKFYDMKRSPVVCPKCGTEIDIEAQFKPRRQDRKKPVAKVVDPLPVDETDVIGVDDDIDADSDDDIDDFMEDASDLGEDETDLDEVKEHIDFDDNE